MKKIIPALAMLLISAIVMSTASFAWFSMNANVEVSGMSVEAKASGALVASNTFNDTYETSVKFETGTQSLTAISYKADGTTNGYQYVSANEYVDPNTGKIVANVPAEVDVYGDCNTPATDDGVYYKDYIVYLAAKGEAITGEELTATVTFGEKAAELGQRAVTVDFYKFAANAKAEVKAEDYVASINHTYTAQAATGTSVDVKLGATDIPLIGAGDAPTTEGVVCVVMRVYVDGALGIGAANYVNSAEGDVEKLDISVDFKTAKPTT